MMIKGVFKFPEKIKALHDGKGNNKQCPASEVVLEELIEEDDPMPNTYKAIYACLFCGGRFGTRHFVVATTDFTIGT